MRKVACLGVVLVLLFSSGCMTQQEKDRVGNAAKIAQEAANKYDPQKTSTGDVKAFLDSNARAWKQFDGAVNGVK